MGPVRVKVRCYAIANNEVRFTTVHALNASNDPEDARGGIQLRIDSPAALEQFAVGKEYYVDFIPADDTPPAP